VAGNRLLESLNKRQSITIADDEQLTPSDVKLTPQTHKEKLDAGWKRVATVLPPEEHQAFKIAALKTNKEMSDIIHELVSKWLNDQT
jgi:hypothetical protein